MTARSKFRTFIKEHSYQAITWVFGDQRGFITLPVLRGPGRGLRLQLDLVRRREAYFWGKYDREILAQLATIVRPGWCVWDCGTYLGFYTCFFARQVGERGRVVAIEPDPRNLERTIHNASLNGLHNVSSLNVAIGMPSGEVEFLLSDDSNSHLPGYYVGGTNAATRWSERDRCLTRIKIPCIGLDQALYEKGLPRPDLIKLDIEGAERDALRHVERLVAEVRPTILLELHNPECDAAAWQFSRRTGYRLLAAETLKPINSQTDVQGTLICLPPG